MKMERMYSLRVCWRMIAMWVLVVLGALDAQAEGVPVPLNVEFVRVDSGASVDGVVSKGDTPGDACIFVLDHSGTMGKEDAFVYTKGLLGGMRDRKTSRWEALLASFAVTLEQIEPGTVVQVVRVSADHAELVRFGDQSRVLIAGARERNEILKAVKNWKKPHGRTPLYHGLFLACQEAKHLIETENRSVTIVVFSDGKDESDNGYTQEQVDAFKELFDDDAFAACLTWIGDVNKGLPAPPFGPKFVWAQPPKSGNVVPPICRVRSSKPSVRVGNPLSASGRVEVPVSYVFSLDAEKWDELVRSGVVANLQLVGQADGQVYGGEGVTVGPEGGRLEFRVPSECFEGASGAEFMVTMGLPEMAGGCRLVPAHPVRVSFEGQGSATISDVKPPTGLTVKVGESIQFAAEGTEGTTWEWAFGDGHSAKGQRGKHAYTAAAPEGIEFTVTAKKSGLQSATATGTVTVVEAGVALEAMPSGLKVGDSTEFRCRGTGEVASYDWFVDDAPVAGAEMAPDGSTGRLVATFDRAGRHTVRVRANMKRVSPEETPNVPFDVSPAPYAAVTSPTPNETFEAESAIDLVAHVEGGAATGIWRIDMADGSPASDPIPAPVVGGTAQAKFTPPASGGTFAVTFEAGEGADAAQSAPVRFSAKSKDVRLDVTEPVPGATVSTGDKLTLRAVTKGLSGTVEFWVEAEDSASAKIGESKVAADGTVALAHVFPAKDGQGSRILVARSADGAITSDPVEFTLETPAGLVLKRPAQNASVTYGGTLDFEAEVDGAVEAGAVRWFLRPLGGGEEALHDAKGAHCEHRFGPVQNRKSVPYEVYARAPLPDGTELETDHAMVRAECREIFAKLELPKDIAPGEDFTVRLDSDSESADIKNVLWDFGDGTTKIAPFADVVRHSFREEGPKTITARAVCGICCEERIFEKQVSVACPPLAPVTLFSDSEIDIGQPVNFRVQHSGKASEYRWTFGDGMLVTNKEPNIAHAYATVGSYTSTVSAVCASCGRTFSSSPATVFARCPALTPVLHFPERNGVQRSSFGLHEEVDIEIRVDSGRERDVGGVRWDFGDGSPMEDTGARLLTAHRYENYASNVIVRAVVVCARCGEESEATGELSIELQPPKAAFEVIPKRDRYSVNGTIELQDASEGDVDRCIWAVNGEEFATCGKGEKVTFDCPSRPGDVLVGLRVENDVLRNREDPRWMDETQNRKLRFRWGLLTALLFAAAGVVLWSVLWRILSGNGIRDYDSYSWSGPKPVVVENQHPARQYRRLGHVEHFRNHWCLLSYFYHPKHVDLQLKDLLKNSKAIIGWSSEELMGIFSFVLKYGKPSLRSFPSDTFRPKADIENALNAASGSVRYFVFEERKKPNRWLFIVVPPPKKNTTVLWCSALLAVGTIAVLGIVLWTIASFSL